jgi:MFS family permease
VLRVDRADANRRRHPFLKPNGALEPSWSFAQILDTTRSVPLSARAKHATNEAKFFYGWVIVAVGFLAHIASAFSISSTLSVFLKPLSQDLGISRGVFSLIRSGEILVGAAAAPLVGSLLDRHGGKWLIAAGGLISGAGFLLLGQARDFWQFALVRWLLISPGDTLMGSMVVNVSISQWFVRMRGRALALAGMGHGLAKVCMPVLAASLIVYIGWRGAWVVFGVVTLVLVVGPSLLFMRRRPEDMGLLPDGRSKAPDVSGAAANNVDTAKARSTAISDQGHPTMVAALVMSIIAVMQFSTPMVWGLLAERTNVAKLIMAKFVIQAVGILLALADPGLVSLYSGFLLYGIGMGGTAILAEMIWANYFGRLSLGRIRGMGSLITSAFSAGGPPFFGLLFDLTQSYSLSFSIFIGMLFASAFLSLFLRPPSK